MDVTLKRYLQRVADTLVDKTGDDEWGTVDLERLHGWGVDPDRSLDENADALLDESVEPHHVGQRDAEVPKKSAAQLDAEIAGVLATPKTARQPLRVQLSKGLGQAIRHHGGTAVFHTLKLTSRGYTFETTDPGVVRAFWFAMAAVFHRPPTRAIGDAVVKKRAELRPMIQESWPEALAK